MSDDAIGSPWTNKLLPDPFLMALNAFGENPDRERLRRALDESIELTAVLTSLVDPIELPEHDVNYLDASPEFSAVFRSLLEMIANRPLTFQVEVVDEGPVFSVEVHDAHARLAIRAWDDQPAPGPS